MAYQHLLLELDGPVAVLTLNRPDLLNAFNDVLIEECTEAFRTLGSAREVRAVIVTGAGRGFSAGQDLEDVKRRREAGAPWSIAEHLREKYNPMIVAMRVLDKPIIAAVNGAAAGAGMSFALAADLRIASEHAKFLQAFVAIGLVPDTGSSWFLPRLVGPSVAFDLCATGRVVGAEEALRIGLVSRVVSAPVLMTAARALAMELARKSPAALARIKSMLNLSWSSDLGDALALEAQLQHEASQTPEYIQLVDEFLLRSERKK